MIDKISNHVERALNRLHSQHKDEPNLEAFISVFSQSIQDAEDGMYPLLTNRTIDNSFGDQLDIIGRIVLQDRGGLPDDDYRLRLRVRIAATKSRGSTDELINIVRLVIITPNLSVVVEMYFPASVVITTFNAAVSQEQANVLAEFLRDATSAGVRVQVVTSDDANENNMFYTAVATSLSGAHPLGSSFLTTTSADDFPLSGQVVIDEGRSMEETVTYSKRVGSTFVLVGTTSNAHDDRAGVVLIGTIGLGLGDAADSGVGGKLSSAQE